MILSGRFDDALLFASSLHRHQVRKSTTTPYLAHLLSVAALVIEDGGSENEAIAALLHDAIEDQGDTYEGGRPALRERIRAQFGDAVLAIVNDCTDDDGWSKGTAATFEGEARAWRGRKEAYLEHLRRLEGPSLRVSMADKLHNLRAIVSGYREHGEALWRRFRTRSGDDQYWYYSELQRIFEGNGTRPMAAEIAELMRQWRDLRAGLPAADQRR